MIIIKNYRARHIQLAIRSAVRCDYSVERVKISNDGSVHAHGRMPNSIKTGWFFVGYDRDVMSRIHAAIARATGAAQ